jgi:hypothetical protein
MSGDDKGASMGMLHVLGLVTALLHAGLYRRSALRRHPTSPP